MSLLKSILVLVSFSISFAYGFNLDPNYHTIDRVEIVELNSEILEDYNTEKLGDIIAVVDNLVALGTSVIDIISNNAPVVSTQFITPVSVLPKIKGDVVAFHDLENWSLPQVKNYRVAFKNKLGIEVISFTYAIQYQHSGTYEGKGHYLTGVRVYAKNISTAWGFKLNATSKLISISNLATKEDPKASVALEINYQAKSWLKEIRDTVSFTVTGDGKVIQTN